MRTKELVVVLITLLLGYIACCCKPHPQQEPQTTQDSVLVDSIKESESIEPLVSIVDTLGLRIYTPHYSKIDLVCGTMPAKDDRSVIFVAEAAFTGQLLEEFKHMNIHGDHVTGSKREKGTPSKRNTGAFVYYKDGYKFLYKNYSHELDSAALNGGCGFGQEMMIHEGREVPYTRPSGNKNEFRALCSYQDEVVVMDTKGVMSFGAFVSNMLSLGVTEALYLDMGRGWNYSWYRDEAGKAVEIHPVRTRYATNWITFYK